jgi:threonine aldolase
LDGARLFNAVVASGVPAAQWAQHFDTVSVCFSKGLGAPVGSALCGTRQMIDRALRHRKVFGGGMRQSGVIASAALYALENHVERLAEDHANAKRLGEAIRQIEGLELRPPQVDTNLIIFRVDPRLGTAADFSGRLKLHGLLVGAFDGVFIRAVTHLDVGQEEVDRAAEILRLVTAEAGNGAPHVGAARSAYA